MKNPYAIAFASALLTAGLIKAAPALAEPAPSETRTYVSYVQTSGLDLASQNGQRSLDRRLAQAAREVCGVASDADLVGQNKARECRADAISRAGSEREGLLAAANRGAVVAITASR
jgi:UrcA family protein